MKSVPLSKILALSFIFAFAAIGCKKPRPHVTVIPGDSTKAPGGSNTSGPLTGSTLPGDTGPGRVSVPPGDLGQGTRPENFNEDRETFKEQTVYFDFDTATIRPGEKFKVEAVASYLKSNPTMQVRVEGNCDERGTDEYNRSLGERRALSARETLVAAGITPDRVSTISYGEDKPAVAGHDEAAWAKNRRADFVLLKPKAAQ